MTFDLELFASLTHRRSSPGIKNQDYRSRVSKDDNAVRTVLGPQSRAVFLVI